MSAHGGPGERFLADLLEHRQQFAKYLGAARVLDDDPKNAVTSWIVNSINLIDKENRVRLLFDPSVPVTHDYAESINRTVADGSRIVAVRVGDSREDEQFEDLFMNTIMAIMKTRYDGALREQKSDFMAGEKVARPKVVEAVVRLNHKLLHEVAKLRKGRFRNWGLRYRVFRANSKWDAVKEADFQRWREDEANKKLRVLFQRQGNRIYNSWATELDARRRGVGSGKSF